MVRKKQKGLVKESLASGAAGGAPAAVDVQASVAQVPLNSPVPFSVETDGKKTSNANESKNENDLATWYAALGHAATRYDQLKQLQHFRANVKKLSGSESGYALFMEATWRLMFRLYTFHSATLFPLQKNFWLILQDLIANITSTDARAVDLDTVVREELRVALDGLFKAAKEVAQDGEELVKVLNHLLTLLEFPYVLNILLHDSDNGSSSSYLHKTVHFLADQLEVLVAPIAEYNTAVTLDEPAGEQDVNNDPYHDDSNTSGPTNAVLVASERCSFALKCTIMLASLKDSLLDQLRGSIQKPFSEVSVDLSRLLTHCTLILTTRVIHKDVLTQTGLAYCLLRRLLLQRSSTETNTASSSSQPRMVELLLKELFPDPEAKAVNATALSSNFGDFARLAVLRGFVNSLTDDQLMLPIHQLLVLTGSQKNGGGAASSTQSLLDFVFLSVHKSCSEQALNTRLYAFQVLEAFLRRAVNAITKQTDTDAETKNMETERIATSTIASLTSAVLLNWENPSKRVNQFMQIMFSHIVNFQVLSGVFDDWKHSVVAKLIQLPPHSRARYGALSIMVTKYGATKLLEQHPGLLQSILHAVGIKDVSAAAASLFAQVLDELNESGKRAASSDDAVMALDKWRAYWMDDVVAVLRSRDAKLRASVAMYALPLLLKKDPACVASLIAKLRDHTDQNDDAATKDVSLWAIIEVLKFARKRLSPEKLLGLSMVDEIQRGLENARPEARGAAFEALCSSLKTTNLPTKEEITLLKKFLVVSAKEITASSRMNSLNSFKTVLFRVKEFVRINAKDAANTRLKEQEKQLLAKERARATSFQQWLELFIVTSVYPGALVQRSIIGLEVLLLYVQVFGVYGCCDGDDDNENKSSGSLLATPHMVTCLLNMLIGSWDVVRSLANTILDLYPADLPGFTTHNEMEMLWKWALTLCISPRQRESDAGAHFMQLLYTRSESLVALHVADLPRVAVLPTGEELPIHDPRVRVVLKLADIISARLESVDTSRGESPLVHGLLLSVRNIIDSTDFHALEPLIANRSEWKHVFARVFDCVHRSMKLSLAVVGDATSGVGDENLSDTFDGVVGEVSSAGGKTSAIPLRVDCRGHLILDDAAASATETNKNAGAPSAEDDEAADTEQRAVVGSWLAARECGAIVDTIMRRVPLPVSEDADNIFPVELALQSGDMLLNSLFELKHKGAVAMAYEAFEGICKSFLAHGDKNSALSGLPSLYADKLLDRLEKSEQQFILRRSSGFAYSFVAILRAEPRNAAAIILPRVMANLLRLASKDTDALAAANNHHLVWRSRVHALNILKLISQDAVLADDVAVYVAQMLEYAIFGFECRSWVVRNSSMMLFAAATQRALGDKRIADGASKNKIPSAEVFSRFPQLDAFLFRALERFTSVGTASNGVAPPGLFPVLMFLSRLRPTDEDEDEQLRQRGSKPLADFVPLVMQCASQSVLPIRDMAARVLGTIVRVDNAASVLALLSQALPSNVREARSSSSSSATAGSPTSPSAPKTANFVHGVLLQAQSLINKCLLVAAAAAAPSGWTKETDEVLAFVTTTFLPTHLWLASDRVKSASIRGVMWEIVEALLSFQAQHKDRLVIDSVITQVTTATLTKVDVLAFADVTNRVPGEYKCHRAIVGTFFHLLQLSWTPTTTTNATNDLWVGRVESLLQSRVLEVRKRAVKKLAKLLESDGLNWSKQSVILAGLEAVLLKQLAVETHPTVKTRLLQQLLQIHDSSSATTNKRMPSSAVETFLELLASSANVDVIGPALKLLASCARTSGGGGQGATSEAVLQALTENVVTRSGEAQPLGLRYAAAVAIERSQLLLVARLEISVDAWMTAIKLLQDDDSHVRDVIRVAVHTALCVVDSSIALDKSVSETALLPVAIQYMVQTFVSTAYGFGKITTLLLSTVDATSLLIECTTGAKAQDSGESQLCSRIFEAEGNNFYAENDLVAHLFATCVFTQTTTPLTFELKKAVLTNLLESLTLLNEYRTREQWLGGMTYYASVFPTLFSLLCVGVAALESLTVSERAEPSCAQLVAALQAQAKILLPHMQHNHPLLIKALTAISQDNENEEKASVVTELVFLSPEWAAIRNYSNP